MNTSSVLPLPEKKTFNYNLEALRAVAAITVIYHHAIAHKFILDPAYKPSGIWSFNPPGHLSVLIFFILSGFVIGLTNPVPLRGKEILTYLKKRFVRIYPIYAISILFTWLVALPAYDVTKLLCALSFSYIFGVGGIMWENNPIWSLGFEVLYYLLFIIVSVFRINEKVLVVLTFVIPFILAFFFPAAKVGVLIPDVAFFCFWILGVVISREYKNKDSNSVNYVMLASSLLAFLSLEYFNILLTIFIRIIDWVKPYAFIGEVDWIANTGSIKDFASLPVCLIVILLFVGVQNKILSYAYYLFQLVNIMTFFYIFQHRQDENIKSFFIPSLLYLCSVLLIFMQNSKNVNILLRNFMKRAAALGVISYGIYIIHFPILFCFSKVSWFSGSSMSFLLRFVIFVFLTLLAAYILEKKIQPWARKYLA